MLLSFLSHSDWVLARIISWHWGVITTIPPFPVSFCFVSCGSTVFYKFRSPAKGKFLFAGLAGEKVLYVPVPEASGTATDASAYQLLPDPSTLLWHLILGIPNRTDHTQPLKSSSLLLLDFTEKATDSYFFPWGVFKLLLFTVYCCYSFLFVLLWVCWVWGGML